MNHWSNTKNSTLFFYEDNTFASNNNFKLNGNKITLIKYICWFRLSYFKIISYKKFNNSEYRCWGSSGYWSVPNTSNFQRIFEYHENKYDYFFLLFYILWYSLELCKNEICSKRCIQHVQTVLSWRTKRINDIGDVRQTAYFEEHRW